MTVPEQPLVELQGVARHFDVPRPWYKRLEAGAEKPVLRAVDGVDIVIPKGKTFSLVGESGCGKSTLARLAAGLYPLSAGAVRFDGRPLVVEDGDFRVPSVRRRIQMVFQNPYASLNPRWRVGRVVEEPLVVHEPALTGAERRAKVDALLRQVGLDESVISKFPHQFSGGQRQRISIARALATNPDLLIWDEPTSALDVSVQAQILNLMRGLQEELGLTYLFISHNLSVVRFVSDFIGVMYLGRLVEWNAGDALFRNPRHPYTQKLLDSVPSLESTSAAREPIAGEVPSPLNPPSGCHFHPRCPYAIEQCREVIPEMQEIGTGGVRCHLVANDGLE